jgi:hypothetical protein
MSESSPIGNGRNVRAQAGRLRNAVDSFVIEDSWIVAQPIRCTVGASTLS